MKNKSSNSTQNIVNYIRTKDAYDGNMEITNLKSCSQKITSTTEPLSSHSDSDKDEPAK